MSSATFTASGRGPSDAIAGLAALGFVFGSPRPVTRTLLDTFDGRLHAAGLRLEAHGPAPLRLVLSSARGPAHLMVDAMPRRPADLPRGPFRARIAEVVDVRALLPIVGVEATATDGEWRAAAGKTVATATVYADLAVDGEALPDGSTWTVEILERTGYRSYATRAAAALEQAGLARVAGGPLDVVAAATGVDLRGFSSTPSVALDPTMLALDGFCLVLDELAGAVAANWQGTADAIDPEFLHDLRVAVRRSRSVIARGRRVLPAELVSFGSERFGWLGAATGPARDLDVQLLEWEDTTADLGDDAAHLAPVRAVLEERGRQAHDTLATVLRSPEATSLLGTWREMLRDPASAGVPGDHAARPLGAVVGRRIERAQGRLLEHGRAIGPETPPATVHELRKDAKKLRYLLECFGGVLAAGPRREFVRRLKALQDNLGTFQDADVHIDQLQGLSVELQVTGAPAGTILALGRLVERLHVRRVAARAEFADRFRAYDTGATADAFRAMLEEVGS